MKTSDISRACLQAFVDKARDLAEALLTEDFRFTSPLDNGLDRATYFQRCWPNSSSMQGVKIVETIDGDNQAFIVYEVDTGTKRFRNCERHMSLGHQLTSVEVYIGWDLPHPAPPGGFVAAQRDS